MAWIKLTIHVFEKGSDFNLNYYLKLLKKKVIERQEVKIFFLTHIIRTLIHLVHTQIYTRF